jgi:hypothetical protein
MADAAGAPCPLAAESRRLADDAVSYLTSEVRPVIERQPGNLGTSLLID